MALPWESERERGAEMGTATAATFYGSGSGIEEPNQRVTSRVGAPHTERRKKNTEKQKNRLYKIKDTRMDSQAVGRTDGQFQFQVSGRT